VEVYAWVRRAVQVDGMSQRQAAREFGLSRKTIRKMLAYSAPPGYARKKPVLRPKLGPWLGIIDQVLDDDQSQPKKQRHTARRIWERLKAEHGFGGGYTVVKDYVRQARLRHKEVFVPLAHPPGDAQADFGEALVVIGGVERKGHFLCMDRWSTFTPPLTCINPTDKGSPKRSSNASSFVVRNEQGRKTLTPVSVRDYREKREVGSLDAQRAIGIS
jgi:transposase